MRTASTREIRSFIRSNYNVFSPLFTDKTVNPHERTVGFIHLSSGSGRIISDAQLTEVINKLRAAGFDNAAKVTSGVYLRIRALKA